MKSRTNRLLTLSAFVLTLGLGNIATPAFAVKQTGDEYNTLFAGLGAKGYDVVSYFTAGKPAPGAERFSTEYGGVKWQFSSAENLAMFKSDPAKYAPQYGGFCVWGGSVGKLFDVDPVNGWKIVDGKLYMNFNSDINATFSKDTQGFISKANRNWPSLNK